MKEGKKEHFGRAGQRQNTSAPLFARRKQKQGEKEMKEWPRTLFRRKPQSDSDLRRKRDENVLKPARPADTGENQ